MIAARHIYLYPPIYLSTHIDRLRPALLQEYPMSAVRSVVSIADFDNLVTGTVPVLVDFWGPWCKPCRALDPVIEELAAKAGNGLVCVKVNVEEAGPLAHALQVKSLPTLMVFRGGELVRRRIGASSREKLLAWVEETLLER